MAVDAPALALNPSVLVLFGALPGTGRPHISRLLVRRIDAIELAIRDAAFLAQAGPD